MGAENNKLICGGQKLIHSTEVFGPVKKTKKLKIGDLGDLRSVVIFKVNNEDYLGPISKPWGLYQVLCGGWYGVGARRCS